MDRKTQIRICLDEIEASLDHMSNKDINQAAISKLKSWIRTHKDILKELNYKGKMPKQRHRKRKSRT